MFARAEMLCEPHHELIDGMQVRIFAEVIRQRLMERDDPVMERDRIRVEERRPVRTRGGKLRYSMRTHTEERMYRRITIGAYDECDGHIHYIPIRVPHPLPTRTQGGKSVPVFSYENLDPNYVVTHEGGVGVARMRFSVRYGNRELTVLGLRHPRFPTTYWRSRDARVMTLARAAVYTPYYRGYHHTHYSDSLKRIGYALWQDDILHVYRALAHVPSRAFPGRTLPEVWPASMLVVLGVIEQSDDGAWRDDPVRTGEAVLMEYALNRAPFYFANSSADAIGLYQFTNKKGNGTYDLTVRACPVAQLRPDFDPGVRDVQNGMKAALCLLDLELAQMPDGARTLFLEDYRLGSTYPVAAYNGGGGQAQKLYRELPPEDVADAMAELTLPMRAFQFRKGKGKPVRINHETRYYLFKMFGMWSLVETWETSYRE
jgi:hypothetical protein